jgi:hypothetical protein
MLRIFLLLAVGILCAQPNATRPNFDPAISQILPGEHKLTLNWIHLDTRTTGAVTVEVDGNNWKIFGDHRSNKNRDSLVINGTITSITPKGFYFKGRLTTQVSYNFVGKVCERRGLLFFEFAKDRQSWVLKETPLCGTHKDVITLFLARP